MNALKSNEFIAQVPINKREILMERTRKAQSPFGPGYITFQDFVNIVSPFFSFNIMVSDKICV